MNKPSDAAGLIDPHRFRHVMGCYATGVAIVTTVGVAGKPVGLTINSFNSVSIDPPLVLWCLSLSSPNLSCFRQHPSFAINILTDQQVEICQQFAHHSDDKFEGVDWHAGINGVPILRNTLATIECENVRQHAGGDHEIFIGRVQKLDSRDAQPLIFSSGQFRGVSKAFK